MALRLVVHVLIIALGIAILMAWLRGEKTWGRWLRCSCARPLRTHTVGEAGRQGSGQAGGGPAATMQSNGVVGSLPVSVNLLLYFFLCHRSSAQAINSPCDAIAPPEEKGSCSEGNKRRRGPRTWLTSPALGVLSTTTSCSAE